MSEDLQDFESFPDDVREGIRELGWSQPMPVQSRVIPLMRQGRDLIVQALTGSGKTGASACRSSSSSIPSSVGSKC